jgi:hypothetical protein
VYFLKAFFMTDIPSDTQEHGVNNGSDTSDYFDDYINRKDPLIEAENIDRDAVTEWVTLGDTEFEVAGDPKAGFVDYVYSANWFNGAPAVIQARPANQPDTEATPLERALESYLLQIVDEEYQEGGEFVLANPETNLSTVQVWVLDPPKPEDEAPLAYLEQPDAPEVIGLQNQINAQFSERSDGLTIDQVTANPEFLKAISPNELGHMIAIMQGDRLSDAQLHGSVRSSLFDDYYNNAPDTQTDLPIGSRFTEEGSDEATDVVFRLNDNQQTVLSMLYAEHARRSEAAALEVIGDKDVSSLELPYTDAELIQMGLNPETPLGQAGMVILERFGEKLGDPEQLKQVFPPEETRFSFTYNQTTNDDFDYRATIPAAAVGVTDTTIGDPVPVSESNNAYLQALLPSDTLTYGGTRDPNKQFISFNLPIQVERAHAENIDPADKAANDLGNEIGNAVFYNAIQDLTGFTETRSAQDPAVRQTETLAFGMVAEPYSDAFETWISLSPEDQQALNELAETEPENASKMFLAMINEQISNPSNADRSELTQEEYASLQTTGDLTEDEIWAHRHGVLYKAQHGTSPDNLLFEENREISENALKSALKNMGMSGSMADAFTAYIFDTHLPLALAQASSVNASGTYEALPEQNLANLQELANNGQ